MKKSLSLVLTVFLSLTAAIPASAAVSYLPGVTAGMSQGSYWTEDQTVHMTAEEIKALNTLTISAEGTNMYNLKELPETVDGFALNEALKTSSQADTSYYLGWTYLGSNKLAEQKDFDKMIANTQNPKPSSEQAVKYAVAVNHTELRSFPSDTPIWDAVSDPDTDYQYLVSVRVNEPLVITSVSADGKYYLAKSICCSGWVPVEDVAVCRNKKQWLTAWDIPAEEALVVYGDKVYTETSQTGKQTSARMLIMGTVLRLEEVSDPRMLIDNRSAYQNHVAWMPVRNEDGSYAKRLTLFSEHKKVSEGYLPLTQENIAEVALSALGNTYGWGGSLDSTDCSGYIRNIYKCFGLELARNTTWQTAMPMAKVDLQGMTTEERKAVLDETPMGAVLYFRGHEMMYLGCENGTYYVISAIGNIIDPMGSKNVQRISSVVINTLDTRRGNGNTWLDDLTTVIVPFEDGLTAE